MPTVGYYLFDDMKNMENRRNGLNLCSVASDKQPLEINCTGCFFTKSRFAVENKEGRKDYYFLYVSSGTLELVLPQSRVIMSKGNFVIIPPQTKYQYAHTEGKLEYFWVHFTGSQVQNLLSEYELPLYPTVCFVEDDGSVGRKFGNLFDACAKQDRFRARDLAAIFDRLMIFLARRSANNGRDDRVLAASMRMMHTAYHTELRVAQLAKAENLSVSRYNAIFRKLMGRSPVDYLTELRISSACDLLVETDLSVKEISFLVGFSDPHFFSRVFRSRLGVSPRCYRSGERQEGGKVDEVSS